MENPLHRRGGGVSAGQDRRMVALSGIWSNVRMLGARAEKAVHRALAVRAREPAALGAELELGEFRLGADGVDRGEQRRRIDAVHRNWRALGLLGGCHSCVHILSPLFSVGFGLRLPALPAWSP